MALFITRLTYRGGLFLLALISPGLLSAAFGLRSGLNFIHLIWLSYFICMLSKLLPSRVSLGRNKILPKYYTEPQPRPTEERAEAVRRAQNRGALKVAAVWIGLNAILFWLYFRGVLDRTHMVLISLFYYLADMVCIGFFCPFQVFLMKNRCCVTCRIYSWDALMMVTPLLVLNTAFSWSLVAVALVIFIRWELAFHYHPGRFSHETNGMLRCDLCTEHSCRIKGPGGLGLLKKGRGRP